MKYVPYPSSWFNGHRFNDDPLTWERFADLSESKKQISILQDLIDRHPANPHSVHYSEDRITEEQRKDLAELRDKKQQLQQSMF